MQFAKLMGLGVLGLALVVGAGISGGTKRVKGKEPPSEKGSQLPSGWTDLNLTDEQNVKVHSIVSDFRPKILHSEKKAADLKAAEQAEMVKVLTEGQKAQLLMQQGDGDGKHTHKKKDQ